MLPFHDGPVIHENIIMKILLASCSAKISYRKISAYTVVLCIILHLCVLNSICGFSAQFINKVRPFQRLVWSSEECMTLYIKQSSANRWIWLSTFSVILFIDKRTGHNTDPWGTPDRILHNDEEKPFTTTCCERFSKRL